MSPPLKTDQKKKDDGEVGREPNPSSPTELKQRQKSWQEEREGSRQAQELRPILFLREGGRGGREGGKAREMVSQPLGNKTSSLLQRS